MKADQPTSLPTSKVTAAAVAGAMTIVFVYLVQLIYNVDIPAVVATAITAIITFATGYMTKESA